MMWEVALGCSCKAIRLKPSVYKYFDVHDESYLLTDLNLLCYVRIGPNDCSFIFLYRISVYLCFPSELHY